MRCFIIEFSTEVAWRPFDEKVATNSRTMETSRDDFMNDTAGFDTSELLFELLKRECQASMINAQQVQDCCVEISRVYSVFHDIVTEFVCGASEHLS